MRGRPRKYKRSGRAGVNTFLTGLIVKKLTPYNSDESVFGGNYHLWSYNSLFRKTDCFGIRVNNN